jgi:pantothenate kinase
MKDIMSIADTLRVNARDRRRYFVAIAGPPGAGKTTFSSQLEQALPNGSAATLQMDGFHYDNDVLDMFSLRPKKGAPETFDFAGFMSILRRLRSAENTVAVPVFDRALDVARAGAQVIPATVKFILVEGNYLLLREDPWSSLMDIFDYKISLSVSREELKRRLVLRWLEHGFEPDEALRRASENDMHNVDRVLTRSDAADVVVEHC